jgi:hypothetical protein
MKMLFPVPLMGQGTADVESLPSYLSRCAYEHGVSVGMLAKWLEEINPGLQTNFPKPQKSLPTINSIARCNQHSSALREALSILTGQDLRCRPLEFLDRYVYGISRDIEGFRWCPECFTEQLKIGEPLYFKQLWHMTAVSHCHIHRTPLISQCGECGSEQMHFSSEMPLGYCVKCNALLSGRHEPITPDQVESPWKSYSFDIVDVFAQTAKEVPDIDPDGQRKHLDRVSSAIDRIGTLSKGWTDIIIEYLKKYPNGKRLISQRRLAYYLNISLYNLLTLRESDFAVTLFSKISEEIPEYLEKTGRIHRDHVEVRRRLEQIASTHEPPVSLRVLARWGRVSVGYIDYRFPDLAKRVIERHRRYQEREQLVKQYRAQAAALRFFTDDRYADHTRSRKEAYRVLKEETGLPKWVLKNAIQTAYGALQVGG